jgi:hypothetical protein
MPPAGQSKAQSKNVVFDPSAGCWLKMQIRIDLRDSGRKLSWLGNEPGLTGFHRVTYALGLQLVEKLESMIDAETEKYAQESIAGLHPASS